MSKLENQMPDLSQLNQTEIELLLKEITELDGLSYYPASFLGANAYLSSLTRRNQGSEETKLQRYIALIEKYPWFRSTHEVRNAAASANLLEVASVANTGVATTDTSIAERNTAERIRSNPPSLELIKAELQRRISQ